MLVILVAAQVVVIGLMVDYNLLTGLILFDFSGLGPGVCNYTGGCSGCGRIISY